MSKNNNEIKEYRDNLKTESMYDKNLLQLEIQSLINYILPADAVLDVGCGKGEDALEYAKKCKKIIAFDYSDTRLKLLYKKEKKDIKFVKEDMLNLQSYFQSNYSDAIIAQRSLISLSSFTDNLKSFLCLILKYLKRNLIKKFNIKSLLKIQIIRNLTYEKYEKVIFVAKYTLTFREKLVGYHL